jgi:hypothetical protein
MKTAMIVRARRKLGNMLVNFLILTVAIAMTGCKPKIIKFDAAIVSNRPVPTADVASQQGTIHACPGGSIRLIWAVQGGASLNATQGARYQPPACFHLPNPPSQGEHDISTTKTQMVEACGDHAIFRLTASKTFFRHSGPCPGDGCPNADREMIIASDVTERIGNNVTGCVNDAYEVTNIRPTLDWDDRYQIGIVSVEGSSIEAILEKTPGRTLTLLHDGKDVAFSAGSLTSDRLRGTRISGTWTLRLSGCSSPPPALIVKVQASCSK